MFKFYRLNKFMLDSTPEVVLSSDTARSLGRRLGFMGELKEAIERSSPENHIVFYSYNRDRGLDIVSPEEKVDDILAMIHEKLEISSTVNFHIKYIDPETDNLQRKEFRWSIYSITDDMRNQLLSLFRNFDSFHINLSYYSPDKTD